MNLQLSLKKQWFDLTKQGIKTEDYREITPYWVKRLICFSFNNDDYTGCIFDELFDDLRNPQKHHDSVDELLAYFGCEFKTFDTNKMTLGYPKSTDKERIINFEHKGIEIRTGNPDWGAEPNKLYFVIKHGARLNEC